MKKAILWCFSLAMLFMLFAVVSVAAAATTPAAQEFVNLIDFSATDWGDHTYDSETGTLTLTGNDTKDYFTTVLDGISDGKIKLKNGTEKNFSELTFVLEATISAKSQVWQVPFIVFAKNDDTTMEYHFRNTLNNMYVFKNTETVISETGIGYVADGTPYKAIIQVKGNDYSVRTDSGEFSNTAEKENAWTEDLTPCFGIGARAVAGSVFSDMKMYIKDVEIANYIVDMKVNAPAYVEKGAALTGVTADVKYADGSTATLSQDELTISGFSSAVSGKKEIVVSAETLNQTASARAEVTVETRTDLADFAAADYGKNEYDPATGEVILYGDDSTVYIPTVLDGITDGKLKLKDGTEKNISELTFVTRMTVTPAATGGWTGPFMVFSQGKDAQLDSHVRVNMNGGGTPAYVMCRYNDETGWHEDVKTEIGAPNQSEGISYTVTSEMTGSHLKYILEIGGQTYVSEFDVKFKDEAWTGIPCIAFGDRTNADSVISDMQFYVKGVELDNYAKSLTVQTAPADVMQGEELAGGSFLLTMLDGTTQTLTLDDFTISGFDKNAVGKQTVTVSKQNLNGVISATFEIGVEEYVDEVVSYRVSTSKAEYEQGEEFDVSSLVAEEVYESGAVKSVQTSASDFTVSGYDKDKAGKQTVKVMFRGTEYSLQITVHASGKARGCGSAVTGVSVLASTFLVAGILCLMVMEKGKKKPL